MKRWLIEAKKMKAIYHTLNKFEVDASESFLVAECWIPLSNMEILNELLVNESVCKTNPKYFVFNHELNIIKIIISVFLFRKI